jgi:DNA polymerase III subunit chi
MAEVGFYHLLSLPLERALPRLLERALADGHRVLVRAGSAERVGYLDGLLWTYNEASFLPHGSQHDGNAARQPVFLTAEDENPNGATMLVLVDGADAGGLDGFARCCDMFDGNDPAAVEAARRRWSAAKAAGHNLTYWEQTASGWQKRDQ